MRFFRGAIAALLLTAAQTSRGDAPLTTADVVRFLKAGISETTILAEVRNRGFGEPLDPAREADLRTAGATETLVVAVRRVAPGEKAPVVPAPVLPHPTPPAAGATVGQEPTFVARTRTVRIPVSVADAAGAPVLGLKDRDFQVFEDGKKQNVTLFSGERRPLRIAMALDVSGSMQDKAFQVEVALKHFIDLLEPADEVLVITFSDDAHLVQDFTSDRDLLGRVLDKLEMGGGTALYDAAFEAIRKVAPGPAESKAVVLVTDGVDTASFKSFDRLRELARRSEVPVFSIGIDRESVRAGVPHPDGGSGRGGPRPGGGGGQGPPGGPRGGRNGFDGRPLIELAEETGGRAEILKGPEHYTPGDDTPGGERLKTVVESIAVTLRHRYLLGYEPADGKAGWHTLRVDVDRPAATARARKGYYAGS